MMGGSCSLTVTAPAGTGGTDVTYQATISRSGDVYEAGIGQLSGSVFGTSDNSGPRITSITRQNPNSSPTNADSLTWRIVFDESAYNVDASDFTVAGTTATVTNVNQQNQLTYDVTVSGGDLANLNAVVTLSIAGGQNIADIFGNALTNTTPTGTNDNSFQVVNDLSKPTVAILNAPASVASTSAFNVTFQFSEDVTGFMLGDITVGNGSASNFIATNGSTYTADITPSGTGDITIDVAAGVAQDASANTNVAAPQVTVTGNFGPDEDFVRTRTKRVISNFTIRRANEITASEPSLVNRLNGGANGAGAPVGFTGGGTLANNQMAFATSLRQIFNAREASKAKKRTELGQMMGLGQQSLMAPQAGAQTGFDIWLQGKWARVKNDGSESDIGIAYLGADYRASTSLLVGMMLQLDWSDEQDKTENTKAEGQGWMAGPYIAARLHQNLLFDARAAWGQADNKVNPLGTFTDEFDSDRWLASGRLTGDFSRGNWHITPHVGVIYFEEDQKSYTDSNGFFIPGQTVSLGRVTFGPEFRTSIQRASGAAISPHLGIKGIWDFEKAEIIDVATGLAAGSDDLRARAEGGLSIRMPNGWTLDGQGFYDGIGAGGFEAFGGRITLTVPLSRLQQQP